MCGFYTSTKQLLFETNLFLVPKLDGCYPNKNEISQALGKSNDCIIVDILAVLKILIKVISLSHYIALWYKIIFQCIMIKK